MVDLIDVVLVYIDPDRSGTRNIDSELLAARADVDRLLAGMLTFVLLKTLMSGDKFRA